MGCLTREATLPQSWLAALKAPPLLGSAEGLGSRHCGSQRPTWRPPSVSCGMWPRPVGEAASGVSSTCCWLISLN